jgi:hypothetical protein
VPVGGEQARFRAELQQRGSTYSFASRRMFGRQ